MCVTAHFPTCHRDSGCVEAWPTPELGIAIKMQCTRKHVSCAGKMRYRAISAPSAIGMPSVSFHTGDRVFLLNPSIIRVNNLAIQRSPAIMAWGLPFVFGFDCGVSKRKDEERVAESERIRLRHVQPAHSCDLDLPLVPAE